MHQSGDNPGSQVDRLRDLSPEELQAMADRLLQGRKPVKAAVQTRPKDAPTPLSYFQEALWLIEQINPNLSVYNEYIALELKGALDLDAFRHALSMVIERHESLRTRFAVADDGTPWQEVTPMPSSVLEVLAMDDRADAADAARNELQRRFSSVFDLREGPLFDAVLIRVAPDLHLFGWFVHHLVWDAWSSSVFAAELFSFYVETTRAQTPPATPKRDYQYADYAYAQRSDAHKAGFDRQVGYWKRKLAGAPPLIDLPVDRPRTARRTHRGASCRFVLSKAVTTRLQAIAKKAGTTDFVVVLAIFQCLMARLSGQDDVVVRSAFTGRNTRETEALIGFFVNMLPLRTTLDESVGFLGLVEQVKTTVLEAMGNQEVPFERIVAEVAPPRGLGYQPLAQLSFVLHEATDESTQLPGLQVRQLGLDRDSPINDLVLTIRPMGGEFRAELVYATDLFDESTVAGFAARFELLAAAVVADPERPLAGIDLTLPLPSEDSARRPLAQYQQVMWQHMRLQPESAAHYHLCECLCVGHVDPAVFEQAVARTVARTSAFALRFFETPEGGVEQQIGPPAAVEVPVIDFSSEQDPAAAMARWIVIERDRRIDPLREPLYRHALLTSGQGRYFWFTLHHHLAMDGVGLELLKIKVASAYAAIVDGKSDDAGPDRALLHDFLWNDREHVHSAAHRRDLAFWRGLAPGATVSFAQRRSRPARLASRRMSWSLPKTLIAALERMAREFDVSLSRLLIACIALYVRRMCGVDRFALGIPVHGRHGKSHRELVASCMNMLPMTFEVDHSMAAGEGLRAVLGQLDLAVRHSRCAYETIRHAVPTGGAPRSHRIAVNVTTTRRVFPGFAFEPGQFDDWRHCQGEEDLTIRVLLNPDQNEIVVRFDANMELHEHWEQQAQLACLQTFLGALAGSGGVSARIATLPLLDADVAAEQLARYNALRCDYGAPRTIHALFEARAAEAPDAIAAQFEDRTMSYADLNASANWLAFRLRDLGVRPDEVVAVGVERSLEMVIALLAVLKAGAAYVPIDPDYPQERIQYMLVDSAPRVLLTHSALRDRLPVPDGVHVIELDGYADDPLRRRSDDPEPLAGTGHLAYVIYTSGSTGWPKGAMNAHAALYNRILWMQSAYGLRPDDIVLQKTNFSFDVSVWEFFWPLAFGARLVLARPKGHLDSAYLAALVEGAGVTVTHFVPSMLAHFLDESAVERCASLRHVICSGEELTPALAQTFHRRLPAVALHNLYGPTEAAIDVTHWTCEPVERERLPIGHPIGNLRMYVLDASLSPAPPGVPGELYIGGVGVGRGYWKRPGLTAERFIADPFALNPGDRMYRTGDIGRWRGDGCIEYLGREDGQIKIRGFRIETGEIEAQLNRYPGVRESIVLVHEDAGGDKRLIAYVRVAEDDALDVDALRQHLRALLPEYMVPAAIVRLAAWPLTPNGKLDRRALPVPGNDAYGARIHEEPEGTTEQRLAVIWSELLSLERVGRHDNFFDLGGHSLLGIHVIARVRTEFSVTLPFEALFECRDLKSLAQRIDTVAWSQQPVGEEDTADSEGRERLVL